MAIKLQTLAKKIYIYIYIYNYCILLELLIRWRLREKMEKRLTWLGLTVYLHSKRSWIVTSLSYELSGTNLQ